ncbi:outer membrane protein assembly factor BamB family protein [Halorussus ruber]|uniref:outer membrane protein assembly factor BamB family protein n=1 Tax=Halorussus ruber TaxID=1126238 RepID=UPI001B2FF5DC|nr:PQQ-binding-like beta-propeller repeat protein [Halorussus ruber]
MTGERSDRSDGETYASRREVLGSYASRRELLGSIAAAGSLSLAGCSSLSSLRESVEKSLGGSVEPTWRYDIPNASAASPPVVADGQVLVGAQDKALHGIRASDGTAEFRVETGGPIEARPAVPERGGPYHVHSTDGDLYTVNPTGERLWHREGLDERRTIARAGSLLVDLDPYSRSDDERVRGFDAETGEKRFERPVANSYRTAGLTADLFAVQVPADLETRVAALSPSDGSVRWQTEAWSSYPTVVAEDELVIVARRATDGYGSVTGSVVAAYEPDDGSVLWRARLDKEIDGLPRLGPQVYVVVHNEDYSNEEVVALNRQTGEVVWRASAGYDVESIEPTADAVFVGSEVNDPDGGSLARVDCFGLDGTRRWKVVTDAPTVDELVAVGAVVVVSAERELVAVAPDSGETRWRYEPESHSRLALATANRGATDESLYVSYVDAGAVAEFPTGGR